MKEKRQEDSTRVKGIKTLRRYFNTRTLIYMLMILGVLYFFYHCPFLYVFGIPCMGCGMTRALLSVLHLDFKSAFYYHPLFPSIILVSSYYLLEVLGLYKIADRYKKVWIYVISLLYIVVYIIRIFDDNSVINFEFQQSLIYKILQFCKEYSNVLWIIGSKKLIDHIFISKSKNIII